jgi:pimeloyl-ACP methyl ester carboxylesterase
MARDRQPDADTEDLPSAETAFVTRGPTRDDDELAVSRAGALLSLVRPPGVSTTLFRSATEEAREILRLTPVEPGDPEELDGQFETLGEPGRRALDARQYLERRRPASDGADAAEEGFEPVEGQASLASELRAAGPAERDLIEGVQMDVAQDLFATDVLGAQTGRHDAATRLAAASLLDPDPLVQVAAAAAITRFDPGNRLAYAILDAESRYGRPEVAELSRAIIATGRGSETRRVEVEEPAGRRPPEPEVAPDSVLIHGTWARYGKWWQPDGALHRYLSVEEALFPHLYAGRQPFQWSGYFSFRAWKPVKKDWDRQQAADSLAWWAHRKLVERPDLIGHSYGGSLALLATRTEKDVRGLIALSPALHRSTLPDPDHYERVLHVTTKLDLVLLADLSNVRILRTLPRIAEWAMKRTGLLGHGSSHSPALWARSGLTDEVRDSWLPGLTSR